MQKKFCRTPRHYDGSKVTSHHVGSLSTNILTAIREKYEDRPDLVLAAWPEVIGKQLSAMTQAISFLDGVLIVKVANSTLYHILNNRDRMKVLSNLRQKFPKLTIKTIVFRMG